MFEGQTKIGLFFWYVWPSVDVPLTGQTDDAFFLLSRPKITRLDFRKSKLTLVVVEDDEQVNEHAVILALRHRLSKMAADSSDCSGHTVSQPQPRSSEGHVVTSVAP